MPSQQTRAAACCQKDEAEAALLHVNQQSCAATHEDLPACFLSLLQGWEGQDLLQGGDACRQQQAAM